jgi:hypothetical protein
LRALPRSGRVVVVSIILLRNHVLVGPAPAGAAPSVRRSRPTSVQRARVSLGAPAIEARDSRL